MKSVTMDIKVIALISLLVTTSLNILQNNNFTNTLLNRNFNEQFKKICKALHFSRTE